MSVRITTDDKISSTPKELFLTGSGASTSQSTVRDSTTVTITASGGGGSQPSLLVVTITAAEIAAAWDGDENGAAIELTQIVPPAWMLAPYEVANDLDNAVSTGSLTGYEPGASTLDVFSNGNGFGSFLSAVSSPILDAYGGVLQYVAASDHLIVGIALAGSAVYVGYSNSGEGAPTTGSSTLLIPLG